VSCFFHFGPWAQAAQSLPVHDDLITPIPVQPIAVERNPHCGHNLSRLKEIWMRLALAFAVLAALAACNVPLIPFV
ncbi:hypothetical protein, partial [Streptomyces scabiei]|uniref:hypothetical protein n=1 Tax=Streptomyces scabiei TaxID=1930 RepID=UPI0038F66F73